MSWSPVWQQVNLNAALCFSPSADMVGVLIILFSKLQVLWMTNKMAFVQIPIFSYWYSTGCWQVCVMQNWLYLFYVIDKTELLHYMAQPMCKLILNLFRTKKPADPISPSIQDSSLGINNKQFYNLLQMNRFNTLHFQRYWVALWTVGIAVCIVLQVDH